jgi:hypothetical protein
MLRICRTSRSTKVAAYAASQSVGERPRSKMAGYPPAPQASREVAARQVRRIDFGLIERQELQDRGASRQRLRGGRGEREILRTREDEATGSRVIVDERLNPRRQLGGMLDLVENAPPGWAARKPLGSSRANARWSGRSSET